MQPTLVTWALVVFGLITMGTLTNVYLVFLRSPHSQKSTDWLFFAPLFVSGCVGVLLGQAWGYMLFGATGACSLYINIILWFTEKEYVYPSLGPLKYFTYYWGFFVYWGALALAYSVLRISGVEF